MMDGVTATISGGDRIAHVLETIARSASRSHVKVGYLADETYPDGTSVAQVAFWQEFGTPAARFPIPPRPTFRAMISRHRQEWGPQLGKLLKDAGYDAHTAMETMGQIMSEELTDSVLHAEVAGLSPVTLMLRQMRADQPGLQVTLGTVFEAIRRVQEGQKGATGTAARRLIDSGQMERAPNFEVVSGP